MNISKRSMGVVLFVLAPLAGCATVTPPPSMMALEGASQGPVGATSVTAFGGLAGGVYVQPGLGGGARIGHRLSDSVALGVDGVAGGVLYPADFAGPPRTIYSGRLHAQINPNGSEHLAMSFGLGGGGSNNGLAYGTIDAGIRTSGRWANGFFEPFIGGALALSVPAATPEGATREARPGANYDRRFLTTFYFGLDGGFVLHPSDRFDVVLDVPILIGYSASASTLLLVPTVGIRYAFGGEVRRAR